MPIPARLAGLLLTFIALSLPALAAPTDPAPLRGHFLEAEAALERGDRESFRRHLAALEAYPLRPYLLYDDLNARLQQAEDREIRRFLERWGDTPPGRRLRARWLAHLAQAGRWTAFLEDYRDGLGTPLACHRHTALLRTGQRQAALEGVEGLWLVGHSQPGACDEVFDAWRAAGRLTPDLAWERFGLAMKAGQTGLARYLTRYLAADDAPWAQRWLKLHQDPQEIAHADWRADLHPRAGEVLEDTLRRLARREPRQALAAWEAADDHWGLPRQAAREMRRYIALRLTLREMADALPHLETLPAAVFDDQLRAWQTRAALSVQDWQSVAEGITRMSPEAREEAPWRYWHARALERLGDRDSARRLYAQVARERNFYGFLAADRIQAPYRIGHRPLQVSAARLQAVAEHPTLQRALELHALGRIIEARREWYRLQHALQGRDLLAAAQLAHEQGWHDRAIFAVARAGHYDDIDLRFPLVHPGLFRDKAGAQGIDPAWAMAVARQESAFMADARSHAGALGLMQIMPATGRAMAPHVGLQLGHPFRLLEPEVNVSIGTYYLRRNLDRFGGHPMLSTAAYNAGAGRVDRWLPGDRPLAADIWAELIPYAETRKYVRRVFTYRVLYEVRMGQTPTTLSSLLPPVPPADRLMQSATAQQTRWQGDGADPARTPICDAPGYTDRSCL
ncbi:transglycosylase SLT domain-containing protein [Ectothiorhodospira mobilis]|uniref:transglycosylase SLT domain-containing protein n=1 Tax=Ectothiorhodospira mobilis TaxID=195064 RepID=UPI001905D769|nr:transglycosylase SLT domain-containing protein [Ectothiorhodospira mobilis]MBK1691868.1 lytic murein transglycosylase [Ectothiorhodospira mobilis]